MTPTASRFPPCHVRRTTSPVCALYPSPNDDRDGWSGGSAAIIPIRRASFPIYNAGGTFPAPPMGRPGSHKRTWVPDLGVTNSENHQPKS